MDLSKKTGINLSKGSKISLVKENRKLEQVCIGLDWGTIKKKTLGLFTTETAVDLDASVVMFDENNRKVDVVFFNRLMSTDGSVRHSGDDRTGDSSADGSDNEIVYVNLAKVHPKISTIVFFLNSYKGQDFQTIPYSKIRIFEGNKREVISVFATFNLSAEPAFSKKVAMIMGKLVRLNDNWEFQTIGEPSETKDLNETIEEIKSKYI
ncbi:MAG TPA: TerD family protein [Cytophagaceae bacterium]|jgi:tellurium resistance protein TerZ|nr:TerD family protein [Cytophagaceae bacterium]